MIRYLSASSLTVAIISVFVTAGAITGMFFFEFNTSQLLLAFVFYFMYSGVGLGMMFHRYWTHKSFEFKSVFVKWLLTGFGLLTGRGSVIGWVYVHREHHQFSDTEKDPHMKDMSHVRIFLPSISKHGDNVNKRLIRDLLVKEHLDINKYYVPLVLSFPLILFLVDPQLAYFMWFLPVFLTNIVWNAFIYYGHNKPGYKTFSDTRDNSVNSWLFAILTFGEGWHNNHHKYPYKHTTKELPWEIDPLAWVISLVKTNDKVA